MRAADAGRRRLPRRRRHRSQPASSWSTRAKASSPGPWLAASTGDRHVRHARGPHVGCVDVDAGALGARASSRLRRHARPSRLSERASRRSTARARRARAASSSGRSLDHAPARPQVASCRRRSGARRRPSPGVQLPGGPGIRRRSRDGRCRAQRRRRVAPAPVRRPPRLRRLVEAPGDDASTTTCRRFPPPSARRRRRRRCGTMFSPTTATAAESSSASSSYSSNQRVRAPPSFCRTAGRSR